MPITLVVRTEDGLVQEIAGSDDITIGRALDNEVVLEAPSVSRHHARLTTVPGGLQVTDLGSAIGTVLNGREIEPRTPAVLRPGDTLTIAGYSLEASPSQVAAATAVMSGATAIIPQAGRTAVLQINPRIAITTPLGVREAVLSGEVVTLGRDPSNDVVVDNEVVSRRHMQFRRTPLGYQAEDTGSRNGIMSGGRRVERASLVHGDVLEIAGVVSIRYLEMAGEQGLQAAADIVSLAGRAEVIVGRARESELQLDHPAVSLRHARISTERSGARTIEDLGSTNGTFVNGERLAANVTRQIAAGDVIRVGPVRLSLSGEEIAHSDESRNLAVDVVRLNQFVAPSVNLLRDISFAISPHEFVAVVGVSGAGKSTLLGALSGLKPASHGAVLLNGTPLYENFQAFRTTLGYVPQDDILHKELPVGRALEYAAELRLPDDTTSEERHSRVDDVLGTLALQERRNVAIQRLSGGQRKRVSIGAELLTRPGLFFLDEATSGLDPGTESQLMRLLRRLADEGHTIVLITHATKNVMLCDQVAFLARGGYLAYYGPPDEALAYFGVTDFDGIYEKLEEESTPEAWAAQYRQSAQYAENVAGRLQARGIRLEGAEGPGASGAPVAATGGGGITGLLRRARGGRAGASRTAAPGFGGPAPRVRRSSAFRQLGILARRYFDIIRRDRVNFALMFLLAPLVGAIDLIAWDRTILSDKSGEAGQALSMLFLSALFPFLVGALSNVREIVKESAIYLRERAVSLQVWPYVASKLSVSFLFALYHAAAILGLKVLAVDFGDAGMVGVAQLYVTILLAVMSGVVWALVISALTTKEEQAMLLVIAVIIVQVVFSGGVVALSTLGPAGPVLGALTSTNWTFKAVTAAAGLGTDNCSGDFAGCHLPGFGGLPSETERQISFKSTDTAYGDIFNADVYICWFAMIAILVVLTCVLIFLQKRKDTL
jgi:ABC-type multidrug transport system ATPase subunit